MSDRFNEGLAKGIELGVLRERERIIKLLEQVLLPYEIELIRGENK